MVHSERGWSSAQCFAVYMGTTDDLIYLSQCVWMLVRKLSDSLPYQRDVQPRGFRPSGVAIFSR